MPDLFAGMDQPVIPAADPPAAVTGLRCAEDGCAGLLKITWSQRVERWFYRCSCSPGCDGSLPANQDGSPRGNPRTKRLMRARIRAHEVFDALWKSGQCSRGAAYAWLRRVTGLSPEDAHMQQMSEAQCAEVIRLVDEKGPGTAFWRSWHRPDKHRRGGRR